MYFSSFDEWFKIKDWIEVSQAVNQAYFEFIRDGKETHSFVFNERNIELNFSYSDTADDTINFSVHCLETEQWYADCIEPYCSKKDILSEITGIVHTLAWDSLRLKVYEISEEDSEKELQRIRKIVCDFRCYYNDDFLIFYNHEDGHWYGDDSREFIIKINGRQINISSEINAVNDDRTDVYLHCTNTQRTIFDTIECEEDIYRIADEIHLLSTEPEIIKIDTSDYSEEYEQVREILCPAINGSTYAEYMGAYAEERNIELHGKQIKIQFKHQEDSIAVSIDCVTTGKSDSCTVKEFDDNLEELIGKIQKLAWTD